MTPKWSPGPPLGGSGHQPGAPRGKETLGGKLGENSVSLWRSLWESFLHLWAHILLHKARPERKMKVFLALRLQVRFLIDLWLVFGSLKSSKTAVLHWRGCNFRAFTNPRFCSIFCSIVDAFGLPFASLLASWGAMWPPWASKMLSKKLEEKT